MSDDLTVPDRTDIVRALRAGLASINGDTDAVEIVLREIDSPEAGNRFLAALMTVTTALAKRTLPDPIAYFTAWVAAEMAAAEGQRDL